MEMELLNEFLVLAECLNYRLAADKLYISQSVLSRHIQKLESVLEVSLFDRNKHSVVLTPAGELFAKDLRKVIGEYKKAIKHLDMLKKGMVGTLDVSTSKTVCRYFVYDFLVEFEKKYPDIQVNLNIEDKDTPHIQYVQSGSQDCAIVLNWEKHHEESLSGHTFFEDLLYVVVPKKHPLAMRASVRVSELADEQIISCLKKDNIHCHRFFEKLFADNGVVYAPTAYVDNLELVLYNVISGTGISIISGTALGAVPDKLTVVPIEDEKKYVDVDIVWDPNTSNPSLPLFLEEFSKFAKGFKN